MDYLFNEVILTDITHFHSFTEYLLCTRYYFRFIFQWENRSIKKKNISWSYNSPSAGLINHIAGLND